MSRHSASCSRGRRRTRSGSERVGIRGRTLPWLSPGTANVSSWAPQHVFSGRDTLWEASFHSLPFPTRTERKKEEEEEERERQQFHQWCIQQAMEHKKGVATSSESTLISDSCDVLISSAKIWGISLGWRWRNGRIQNDLLAKKVLISPKA